MKWICRGCQKENRRFKPCYIYVEGQGLTMPTCGCLFADGEDDMRHDLYEWKVVEQTVGRKRKL